MAHNTIRVASVLCAALLSGCAMVRIKNVSPERYFEQRRGDILSTGELSPATRQEMGLLSLDTKACLSAPEPCSGTLIGSEEIKSADSLAAAAELWVAHAAELSRTSPDSDRTMDAWLKAARYSYAYFLVFQQNASRLAPRDRDTQIRDYYNYAVENVTASLFRRYRRGEHSNLTSESLPTPAGWSLKLDMSGLREIGDVPVPRELLAASGIGFGGIRNAYRRDGFGAEMVAALPPGTSSPQPSPVSDFPLAGGYSAMPTPNVTCLLDFHGDDVQQVLASRSATLRAFDPLLESAAAIKGENVPLAANFTAGYGVWLARSNFATEAIRTLLDMDKSLDKPHLYMLQPFDPNRRVVLMLHGLASSPEAWVNTANDVLGDDDLRARYQVWLMYYPTNLPLPYNHQAIRETVLKTLKDMDPSGAAKASHGMVVVGHSMGGLLTRLMVSSSNGSHLLDQTLQELRGKGDDASKVREELAPLLEFDPMPEVRRAVFIATPHFGTPSAEGVLAAIVSRLSSIPQGLSTRYSASAAVLATVSGRLPLSIDNLKESDPFVKDIAELPISPDVVYHSIIAVKNPTNLATATDGFVPYRSAHLASAASEKVIVSGHSVQQTPEAVLELRRILRMDAGLQAPQSEPARSE